MFIPYAKNIFLMKLTQENTNEVIYKNRPIVACISQLFTYCFQFIGDILTLYTILGHVLASTYISRVCQ